MSAYTRADYRRDLIRQLRGWQETEGMSDDARRMLWLMLQAADQIDYLMEVLGEKR